MEEECEAVFLRSCGAAISTVSVPHGPLIKDREDTMATLACPLSPSITPCVALCHFHRPASLSSLLLIYEGSAAGD